MPKRYYDAISDGGPGEDDARYASAHYNEAGQHYQQYQQRQAHICSSSSYQQPSAAAAAATSSTSPATSGYSPTHSYTSHAHPHPLDLAPIIPAAHASSSSSSTSHIPAAAAPVPVADAHASAGAPSAESSATSPTDRDRPYTRVPYEDDETYTYVVTPEMREEFFREVHGRQLNTMQPLYQLPADDEEIKRQEYFHKMMYMVMGDKNFVGPVEQVLSFPSRRRKQILDIGTGSGLWAMQMADEFPDVEVTGCDLAPIQPEFVPPNCEFELFDTQLIPYPDEFFDIVHARGIHTGLKNYPLFLEECARVLRPGGLVILAEPEIKPMTENKQQIDGGARGGAPGWHAFWEQYRRCLVGNHIDTTVPTRLGSLLQATGAFDDIVAQEATVPVGFWPKDQGLLTVAQFAWMEHDYFIPSVRPLFLSYGLSEFRAKILIEDAQQDLYYPLIKPYSCVHVSHARKVTSWTAPRRRTRRFR